MNRYHVLALPPHTPLMPGRSVLALLSVPTLCLNHGITSSIAFPLPLSVVNLAHTLLLSSGSIRCVASTYEVFHTVAGAEGTKRVILHTSHSIFTGWLHSGRLHVEAQAGSEWLRGALQRALGQP